MLIPSSSNDSATEKDSGLTSEIKRLLGLKASKMTANEVNALHEHAEVALPALLKKQQRLATIRDIASVAIVIGIYALPALGAVAGAIYSVGMGGGLLGGAFAGGLMTAMATAPAWLPGCVAELWTSYKGSETQAKINFLADNNLKHKKEDPKNRMNEFDMEEHAILSSSILRKKFSHAGKRSTASAASAQPPEVRKGYSEFGIA